MDILDIQENIQNLASIASQGTLEFLVAHLGTHETVLDLSNKYIFEAATKPVARMISKHYTNFNTIKVLTLQNCMLTNQTAIKLLEILSKSKNTLALKQLDIGNNRLKFTEGLAKAISKLFMKSNPTKPKTLNLQGNIVNSAKPLTSLLKTGIIFNELSLYDTCLNQEALEGLSTILSENKPILKLNLAYNNSAFKNSEMISHFAMSVSLNQYIESLDLSGNTSLKSPQSLVHLLTGLQRNRSLQEINLGSIGIGNIGVNFLSKILLNTVPISILLLENNNISSSGLQLLLQNLPPLLWKLDLSYNKFSQSSILETLGQKLNKTRTLRVLNISYAVEIGKLQSHHLISLCEGLKQNVSLTDFVCEGAKIGRDPDYFCSVIGDAISERKLSLTFKISAVNCFSTTVNHTSSFGTINNRILRSLSSIEADRDPSKSTSKI